MSEILKNAHDMAMDLHAAGAMDAIAMRLMDELCLPQKRSKVDHDSVCEDPI